MSLLRLVWGGHIYTGDVGGTVLDEWSCSMSLVGSSGPNVPSILATATSLVQTYHAAANTFIGARCALEWIKVNEFNPASPYQQITDPTLESILGTPVRGAVTASVTPIFISCKVSIDDGTRDRRAKGGWYLPLFSGQASASGVFSSTITSGVRDTSLTLIQGLRAHADVLDVGIWSRENGSVTAATRLRIGNVPDYISRRKNALVETYNTLQI